MKTERELFQDFCEKNFDFERHEQTYFDEQTQCYENDIGEDTESINMAWTVWQASAQRDGYKLVPVELVDEIEDKIWDNLSANHTITNQEGDGFIPVEDIDLGGIYKAMIGAAP